MPAEPISILGPDGVRLAQRAADQADALRQCGALLEQLGAVAPGYAASMHDRERSVSTFLGEGVAIPHGTDEARALVQRTALGFVQYPDGVDWDGEQVSVCIPIAAHGDEHVGILAALATVLMDPDKAAALRSAQAVDDVLALLAPEDDDEEDSA